MPKGRNKGAPPSARERYVGRTISVLRRARGLSQAQLGQRAMLATDTITRLEGAKFSPSLITLFLVADGLGLSLVTVLMAAELVELEGAAWLFRLLRGLDGRAVEEEIAAASKVRGLRGDDD